MRRWITVAVLALPLLAGMCVLEDSAVKGRPRAPAGPQASSVYALAGEFRTVFANLLWLKADNYHHEFVAHEKDWHKNKELIGLLDLVIILDPQFEEAYATAACIRDDNEKALTVLKQGISNNPKSRELHELVAVLYARRMHDPERALPYAKLAVRYSEDNFYRRRTTRLQHTIERMLREKEGASEEQAEPAPQ